MLKIFESQGIFMQKLTIRLLNDEVDAERLAQYSQEFIGTCLAESDIDAKPQQIELDATKKGDGISFAAIIITFISSGSAIAFFDILKAYLLKDKSLEIEFSGKDGETIRLNAKNITKEQFDKVLLLAKNKDISES
jgi:hypothetical protein